MTKPSCVAVVKYDSSRDLMHTWLPPDVRGPGLGLDDRTTMSLLLAEGEYTEPVPLALTQQGRANWLTKRIEALNPVDTARENVRLALNDAINLVRDDCLWVTYFKPHAWSPRSVWNQAGNYRRPRTPCHRLTGNSLPSNFARDTRTVPSSGLLTAWQSPLATRLPPFAPPFTST